MKIIFGRKKETPLVKIKGLRKCLEISIENAKKEHIIAFEEALMFRISQLSKKL